MDDSRDDDINFFCDLLNDDNSDGETAELESANVSSDSQQASKDQVKNQPKRKSIDMFDDRVLDSQPILEKRKDSITDVFGNKKLIDVKLIDDCNNFGPMLSERSGAKILSCDKKRKLEESFHCDENDDLDGLGFFDKFEKRENDRIQQLKDASNKNKAMKEKSQLETNVKLTTENISVEMFSGLRISNCQVDMKGLKLQMLDKTFVKLHQLSVLDSPTCNMIKKQSTTMNWFTFGVLQSKSFQTSKKNGNPYSIWKLTDLQSGSLKTSDISFVSVMLFGNAHSKCYSIPLKRVVGLLNAKLMDNNQQGQHPDSSNKIRQNTTLCVDHHEKILELGDSADIATCKHVISNGPFGSSVDSRQCSNIVDKRRCEYCVYHVRQAYRQMSSARSSLQSSFSGGGAGDGITGNRKAKFGSADSSRSRLFQKLSPDQSMFSSKSIPGGPNHSVPGTGTSSSTLHQESSNHVVTQTIREKDDETLRRLGLTSYQRKSNLDQSANSEKMSKLKTLNDKLNAKSSVTDSIISKVATDISVDMGLHLVNNRGPGAKTLLKSLTNKYHGTDSDGVQKAPSDSMTEARQFLSKMKNGAAVALLSNQPKTIDLNNINLSNRGLNHKDSSVPKLGSFNKKNTSDKSSHAKVRALLLLREKAATKIKGQNSSLIEKRDPNLHEKGATRKKRKVLESIEIKDNTSNARYSKPNKSVSSILSAERIEAIKNIKSINTHLISAHEDTQLQSKFDLLERRESLEEKMVGTRELKVRGVTCDICKYTKVGKQSDMCKSKNHTVRVVHDLTQRFFECSSCKMRVTSIHKYPKPEFECPKCKLSGNEVKWNRCGMMKERKGPSIVPDLVLRGVEQKFLSCDASSATLSVMNS